MAVELVLANGGEFEVIKFPVFGSNGTQTACTSTAPTDAEFASFPSVEAKATTEGEGMRWVFRQADLAVGFFNVPFVHENEKEQK